MYDLEGYGDLPYFAVILSKLMNSTLRTMHRTPPPQTPATLDAILKTSQQAANANTQQPSADRFASLAEEQFFDMQSSEERSSIEAGNVFRVSL